MQPQTKLTAQQRKRLDRQRFLGLQTQRKLLSSRILITPVNGPNTQLAKNLVLAGVNVTLYDDAIATEDDFQSNFLIAYDEIGKNRGKSIFQRIKQMNPNGNNQFFSESLNVADLDSKFLERFTIICTSFSNFKTVSEWDRLTKQANKPYYNIFSAGLYSACYVSLGKNYIYKQPVTKNSPKQFQVNCLSLIECLNKEQVKKSRKKQFEIVQAIIMMSQSQKNSLNYDVFNPLRMHEQMLNCMVDLGQDIKQDIQRNFLINFAKNFGIEYCPVYSVIGSIVSQQIIKVVQNQQQPALNWIVMNSEQGYACVLKLKKQDERITSKPIEITN